MVGICGLISAFTAQGRRSTTDQCHSNRAALLWLKPVTLILTRAQEPSGSSRDLGAAPKLFLRQTVFLTAASEQRAPPGFSSTPHPPPPSADVLEASEKPVTLGPSPEPGHCQTRHA